MTYSTRGLWLLSMDLGEETPQLCLECLVLRSLVVLAEEVSTGL